MVTVDLGNWQCSRIVANKNRRMIVEGLLFSKFMKIFNTFKTAQIDFYNCTFSSFNCTIRHTKICPASGRVFTPYLRQKWTDPNKVSQEETTPQRKPIRKFGVYSTCGAPTRLSRDFFVCLYVASPFDPLRTEKTTDFGVESRDPTTNLCPSSKIPDFFMRRRRGIKKSGIFGVLGWMFCLSVGYSLHRTSDLHAKSMDY